MEITTTHTPEGLVLRLPGHNLRLTVAIEQPVFIDGELGRVATTEIFTPDLGSTPVAVCFTLARLLENAISEHFTKEDGQL